jgi:hypothetical protein
MSEKLSADKLPPVDPLPERMISALRQADGTMQIFGGHHTYELYCRMGVKEYEIVRQLPLWGGEILYLKPIFPTR